MAPKGRLQPRGPSRKSSSSSSTSTTLIFSMLIICLFFILILLALGILSIPSNSISSQKPHDLSSIVQRVTNAGRSEGSDGKVQHWVEIISWEPRAVIYHNFLSKEECEYLINLAKPHMEKSTVVDSVTGKSKDSRVRTSSGTFLERGQDETVRAIEKRIADFTFLPVEHGEGLQVLHYEVGQKYEPHYDYFLDDYNTKNGGQRMATVLMYLSDVEEGGETVFPSATGNISAVPWWNELSECGKEGLSVKPKMGDALLFWSMKPDATPDPSSLHGGCPVIKGNKWSSTKWIRVNEYKSKEECEYLINIAKPLIMKSTVTESKLGDIIDTRAVQKLTTLCCPLYVPPNIVWLFFILIFSMTTCLFFILILLARGIHPIPSNSVNAYDLRSILQRFTNADRSDGCNDKVDHSVEVISWEPRAVIYHNFLSNDECEHLINIAEPYMKKSTIIDHELGEIIDSYFRTCSLTYLDRGLDETVRAIEKRISDFTYLPAENGEGLHIQHYEVGQKFLSHYDFFTGVYNTKNGGQRIATVKMFLSDIEEGGEIIFPSATGNITTLPCWNDWSKSGKGLSVKPKMGDALLIWSIRPDDTLDYSTMQGECPLIKGSKWSATKWICAKEYKP
ncbi:uncharacterized protein [Rutidosis leptorrhynchoides]|uniref:uncharacterized protein n=1 Tax=Rutidosis leptorrhynchoides TaxID=125765 RepID=UPI003A9906D6